MLKTTNVVAIANRCNLGGIYCMLASSELVAMFVYEPKDQYERHCHGYCYCCCCFLFLFLQNSIDSNWRATCITIYFVAFYALLTQFHSYSRFNKGTDISINLGVGIDLIVLSPALSTSGSLSLSFIEANSSKLS